MAQHILEQTDNDRTVKNIFHLLLKLQSSNHVFSVNTKQKRVYRDEQFNEDNFVN